MLAESGNGLVVQASEVDMSRLNSTGGAYGSSSNTIATQALSSLESISTGTSAVNHMNLKNSKSDGKILPLQKKIYLVLDCMTVFASKRDVLDIEGIDKDVLNSYIKANKVRWKDAQSLIRLVDFINNELK